MYSNISRKINNVDSYILFIMRKYLRKRYLDILMPIVTSMGNLGFIWVVMAVALILNKPYRAIGDIVILTLIISTIVGEGIVKHIVKRVRPCYHENNVNLLIAKPMSYSFPSGHTVSSYAVAGVLSVYFPQQKLLFMIIAFLIALSRIYLYVHYPTDVIGGIIIGILCSKLIFVIIQEGYIEKVAAFCQNIL